MRWPWASRELVDQLRTQLAASEEERKRLLEMLLAKPKVEEQPKTIQIAETRSSEAKDNIVDFTTPFDRTMSRFNRAFPRGTIPESRFKARAN